jgi:glycosyltransferase involved in cell wall biosynthesis
VRIAVIYDCLFPHTIGGAERWHRNVAEHLAERHEVVYLTRRQWGAEGPDAPFSVLAVSGPDNLYTSSGRRGIGPTLRFGWGVFRHLLRHSDRYDVVHTASFPYFSVIGAAAALRLRRSRAPLIVDWHELWSRDYWRTYLGPLAGRLGMAVQTLCVRLADLSFTFSRLVEERLGEHGFRGDIVRLSGEYAGPEHSERTDPEGPPLPPTALFAGRHIPEKRVTAIPAAIAAARREVPDLRCLILGDGPETADVRAAVAELGLGDAVEVRGRVSDEEVAQALASATCLLNPSLREGYGLVIVEACVRGTPAIVVAGSDNAAVELVEPGRNGFVAATADPDELARALVACVKGGERLRRRTLEWYAANRERLSLRNSLETIEAAYADLADRAAASPGSDAESGVPA